MSNILPVGDYIAQAVAVGDKPIVELGKGKESGREYAQITFEVTQGEFKGRRSVWRASFSDRALEYTMRGFHAMGFRGNDILAANSQRLDAEVSIKVEHDKFFNDQGEERVTAKIAWVYPKDGSQATMKNPLSHGEAVAFADRLKSKIAGLAASGNSAPQPAAPGDDVPF
jgi:hypothetical protein